MAENTDLPIPAKPAAAPVDANVWHELVKETHRLGALIDQGEDLTPEDVKEVRHLAKQVKSYGTDYRRAVTKAASDYKAKLDQELKAIGYDKIENYIEGKKAAENLARSRRLNDKLTRFNSLVDQALKKSSQLSKSRLAPAASGQLAKRFPKVNSAAKTSEIKDWSMIEKIINQSVAKIDSLLGAVPILMQLSPSSRACVNILQYLATGDEAFIDKKAILEALKADKTEVEDAMMAENLTDDDAVIAMIGKVVNSQKSSRDKILLIQRLIAVYLNK